MINLEVKDISHELTVPSNKRIIDLKYYVDKHFQSQ